MWSGCDPFTAVGFGAAPKDNSTNGDDQLMTLAIVLATLSNSQHKRGHREKGFKSRAAEESRFISSRHLAHYDIMAICQHEQSKIFT